MDPKECIWKNIDAFNDHNGEGVVQTYTEDCELLDMATRELAHGHDFLRMYGKQLYDAFPDARVENIRLISEGNVVAAQMELVGTHAGEFLGYPGTGKVINWPACSFFEMTEGNDRIKKETYYYDRSQLVDQLKA